MKQSIRSHQTVTELLLTLLLRRSGTTLKATEHGLTLIESLLAIVIITITIVAITPPIFWATATRVQNQRVEQAFSLAQGEIDRVRALVERQESTPVLLAQLPPVAGTEAQIRTNNTAPNVAKAANRVVSATACPVQGSSMQNDDGVPPANFSQYIQVDINNDCNPDFLIQSFRSQGLDERGRPFVPGNESGMSLAGFVMGVRVYSFVAKERLDANQGRVEPSQLRGSTGLGTQRDRPLAVLFSTVVRSADSDNLEVYRRLCDGSRAC